MVVDELHLLGESGGRGATLEGLLAKIMFLKGNHRYLSQIKYLCKKIIACNKISLFFIDTIRVIGMSATIGNIKEIAQFLDADTYSQNFRPVAITEYVKCEDYIWTVDLKSEELLTDMISKDYQVI